MFGFVNRVFIVLMNVGGLLAMKCVSMSNLICQPRSAIVDINSNELSYYPFSVRVNKIRRSYNDIDIEILNCVLLTLWKIQMLRCLI